MSVKDKIIVATVLTLLFIEWLIVAAGVLTFGF